MKLIKNNFCFRAAVLALLFGLSVNGWASLHFEFSLSSKSLRISGDGESTDIITADYLNSLYSDGFDENLKYQRNVPVNGNYTQLYIEAGVTKIEDRVFKNDTKLTYAFINATTIGYNAFEGCTNLAKVEFDNGVKNIGNSAFYNTPLTSVTIPSSVTTIGTSAFANTNITNVTLEGRSTNFGTGIFPTDVKYTYKSTAVLYAEWLVSYGKDAVERSKVTEIFIPNDNVANSTCYVSANIGDDFPNVKKVTFSNLVTTIGEHLFQDCTTLEQIKTGTGVNSISSTAFAGCSNLKNVVIESQGVFNNKNFNEKNTLHDIFPYIEELTLGTKVTYVTDHAFEASDYTGRIDFTTVPTAYLRKVTFLGDKTIVGNSAFASCGNLATIEGTVGGVDEYAFQNTNITSISIANSSVIHKYAFAGCKYLSTVILPSSLLRIKDYAFKDCTSLKYFDLSGSITDISNNAFEGCSNLTYLWIYSPTIAGATYSVDNNLLTRFPNVTNVTFGDDITTIGTSAFENKSSNISKLQSVTARSAVKVGANAFMNDGSLNSFSGRIMSVGDFAFYGTDMSNVTISDGAELGQYAFAECKYLLCVELPTTLNTIGLYAFKNCTSLGSINIPSSVTSIKSGAFNGCSALMNLTVNNPDVVGIQSTVFQGVPQSTAQLQVPYYSISKYKNADYWKEFGDIIAVGSVQLSYDLNYYQEENRADVPMILFSRFFTDKWQALYIPFSLSYEDWSENFDVARINDVHQYDYDEDGIIDETGIEIIMVKQGSIDPNTPYMIRAKKSGMYRLQKDWATLYASEEKSYDVSSWNTLFTFTGNYIGIHGRDMYRNGYYALGGGSLHQASSEDDHLLPYRWYLSVTDRNGASKNINEVKVFMRGDDGSLTNINTLETVKESDNDAIYDLTGSRVSKMTKGLYIKNGKKYLVK